jgi:hypothetical protein
MVAGDVMRVGGWHAHDITTAPAHISNVPPCLPRR